jgi:Phosphatidylserine/phosphatidylglycerophosphate/cardiolipin synthases and related enzymes
MFDSFGNMSNNKPLKKRHIKAIRKKGIDIIEYDPIRFPWVNHVLKRDHRKIVVIDGKIGYTGGMNIADYYIKGLPGIGDWRDMHVKIEGKAVEHLQDIFLEMWNKVSKESISKSECAYHDTIKHAIKNGCNIAILDRWPRKTPKAMRKFYVNSINSAQNNIQIINPYFVPTHSIKTSYWQGFKTWSESRNYDTRKIRYKIHP